jgi:hypothetical protein
MENKRKVAAAALYVSLALAGCVYTPGPEYQGQAEVVPPLPAVVELGDEPYYYHNGYHYYYHQDRWEYSRDRRGPWKPLPRESWPREMRYRGHEEQGRGERGEHGDHGEYGEHGEHGDHGGHGR